MRSRALFASIAFAAAAAAAVLALGPRSGEAEVTGAASGTVESTARALANYDRLCMPCHGATGEGDGPGATLLWPRPRDFTRAEYKWRSTLSGKPPTDDDLAAAIRHGVPGTSMHRFANVLASEDVDGLIRLVKGFAPDRFATAAPIIPLGERPAIDKALLAEGKTAYTRLGCAKCHGDTGAGDGPAAADLVKDDGTPERPYDLTKHTFRRPRPAGADRVEAIYKSLITGLTGTPMPSFKETASDRELWAVSAYVESFTAEMSDRDNNPSQIDPVATKLARKEKTFKFGYWPGDPDSPEAEIWGHMLELQGDPPPSLAPAQASLSARQCARCHNKQYREWTGSFHHKAASPGLMAQLVDNEKNCQSPPKEAASPEGSKTTMPETCNAASGKWLEDCQRCHNPLAEQLAIVRPAHWGGGKKRRYIRNPLFDRELQHEGINCASCHVRKHRRHGPPLVPDSRLLGQTGYPLEEMSYYERADFCLACHQGVPSNPQVARKPLLNTYREWLESPYMKRGVQCQHCHMPNREHTFLGVHDPETFRQGVEVDAVTRRNQAGVVSVRVRVTNAGAGHYLPTTPTPAAFLSVQLVDASGKPIAGARAEKRIGRHIDFDGKWVEHEDTRIPPGESIELAGAWRDGRVAEAAGALVTLRVEPDEYYERFYRNNLERELSAESRRLYEEALALTQKSQYVAVRKTFPIR